MITTNQQYIVDLRFQPPKLMPFQSNHNLVDLQNVNSYVKLMQSMKVQQFVKPVNELTHEVIVLAHEAGSFPQSLHWIHSKKKNLSFHLSISSTSYTDSAAFTI